MKLRRIVPLAAVAVLAAGAFLPAQAAPKKFAGSYNVTLLPDPSPNAFHTGLSMGNCFNVNPQAVDRRELKVPGKGKLTVVLDSPDPTGTGNTDWDLYVTDKSGESLGEGTSGSSHEEVDIKFKRAETINVAVCNLAGQPNGTVTYSLG
jgi:hypothetical protein